MANPVVLNAALDRASYTPGQAAKLTFEVSDSDNDTSTVTITVRDQAGATGTATVTLTKTDVLTVTVADSDRTWVKTGGTGNAYEFSSTA